jgi:hypothetical protein
MFYCLDRLQEDELAHLCHEYTHMSSTMFRIQICGWSHFSKRAWARSRVVAFHDSRDYAIHIKPAGKKASTNLSCARRFVFDVACRYLFVTWMLLCRK